MNPRTALLLSILATTAHAGSFVDPQTFTPDQKQDVLDYIVESVPDTDGAVLERLLERAELRAFKTLIHADDTDAYRTARRNCGTPCSYVMLELLYRAEERASKQELAW